MSQMAPVLEDLEVSLQVTKAANDQTPKGSSEKSWKSHNLKVLRLVNYRLRSALDYSTYCLVERLSLYYEQSLKLMTKPRGVNFTDLDEGVTVWSYGSKFGNRNLNLVQNVV